MIALWHKLPAAFEAQLEIIANRAEAYHFDDGHDDVLRAADALEGHGLRGVFFITTDRIGQPDWVTGQHLRELATRGHEIGNHTLSHPLMPELDAEAQRIEIATAQIDLANVLGIRPARFAWPHGRHDPTGDEVVRRFGFVETRDISNVVRRISEKTDEDLRRLFP